MHSNRQTEENSLLFSAAYLLRIIAPLGLNFLTILRAKVCVCMCMCVCMCVCTCLCMCVCPCDRAYLVCVLCVRECFLDLKGMNMFIYNHSIV